MNLPGLLAQMNAVLPELVLCFVICCILVVDMLTPLPRSRQASGSLAVAGLGVSFLGSALQLQLISVAGSAFDAGSLFVLDQTAIIFKLVILGGALLTFTFSMRSEELRGYRFGEYSMLFLGATTGACLLASAGNFIVFLLAIETLSMCSYVLAGFIKNGRFSAEAGLKYTLFGAAASGVMLFGLSYFYGLSGTLNIAHCMEKLAPAFMLQGAAFPAYLALLLVLAGVGFKIAAFPFQFWCPDTYQGAPTPVTAFLSVVSKAAGFAALMRILAPLALSAEFIKAASGTGLIPVQMLIGVLAVATMTFGNLAALRQTNVKRLLAYSAIAHAGYLLMAAAVMQSLAFEAVLLYIVIYLFMNLGAFWVVIALVNRTGSAELSSFRGVAGSIPVLFVALFICLVSLTGIPPTAGFSAKFQLFQVTVGAGLTGMGASGLWSAKAIFFFVLALAGALNSVVSLYYYMKIARVMVFEKAEVSGTLRSSAFDNLLAVALAIPVILLLNFGPVANLVSRSFAAPAKAPAFTAELVTPGGK